MSRNITETKTGRIAANTLYTIAGALVLNGVLQLLVYPRLASELGAERNGTVLFLMAFVNILGPSVGQALNNSRLVLRRDYEVRNGDFNLELLLFSAVGIIVSLFLARDSLSSPAAFLLTALLILITVFRYYGDVEYRLSLNYRRYFLYYLMCGIGYVIGYILFRFTGVWYLIFLCGEMLALLYLAATGSVFRDFFRRSSVFPAVIRKGSLLVLSYFVTNLTLNIDRLFLKSTLGGEAVTTYYVTSLIGKTLVLFIAPVNTIVISYMTRDNMRPDRRTFLKFSAVGAGVAALFFVACEIVTPIFVRIFYPGLTENVLPLLTTVTLTQILAMLSAYLFIVVLSFTGEKWQLLLQSCHLGLLLILIVVMTPGGGLAGFSLAVLAANLARVAAVLILGFCAAEK